MVSRSTMVVRNGNPFVALQNVSINDVAPDHASNTKWLQMNGGGGEAIEAWTGITNGTAIPIGKVVVYDGEFYGCWVAHSKAATPTPNANDAQWRLLSTYLGGWRSGAFPKGSIVERAGHFWVANKNVASGQGSPTAANQTNWVQIDNDPTLELLAPSITRTYADLTLPSNYTDYEDLYLGLQGSGDGEEAFLVIPTALLALSSTSGDGTTWGSVDAGDTATSSSFYTFRFNSSTRIIKRVSSDLLRVLYAKLR